MNNSYPVAIRSAVALAIILQRELELDFDELTSHGSTSFEALRSFNELRGMMLDYWRSVFE